MYSILNASIPMRHTNVFIIQYIQDYDYIRDIGFVGYCDMMYRGILEISEKLSPIYLPQLIALKQNLHLVVILHPKASLSELFSNLIVYLVFHLKNNKLNQRDKNIISLIKFLLQKTACSFMHLSNWSHIQIEIYICFTKKFSYDFHGNKASR